MRRQPSSLSRLAPALEVRHPAGSSPRRRALTRGALFWTGYAVWTAGALTAFGLMIARLVFWVVGA